MRVKLGAKNAHVLHVATRQRPDLGGEDGHDRHGVAKGIEEFDIVSLPVVVDFNDGAGIACLKPLGGDGLSERNNVECSDHRGCLIG